jgi:hypothetical protein
MARFPPSVCEEIAALDVVGNIAAAVGKNLAFSSTALASLAVIGAFLARCAAKQTTDPVYDLPGELARVDRAGSVGLTSPIVFACLVLGANVPYWVCGLAMKAVAGVATTVVDEAVRQRGDSGADQPELYAHHPDDPPGSAAPDYAQCGRVAAAASFRAAYAPLALVLLAPLLVGSVLGVEAVAGLLAGALISALQMAPYMSNAGAAWDNAKRRAAAQGCSGDDKMFASASWAGAGLDDSDRGPAPDGMPVMSRGITPQPDLEFCSRASTVAAVSAADQPCPAVAPSRFWMAPAGLECIVASAEVGIACHSHARPPTAFFSHTMPCLAAGAPPSGATAGDREPAKLAEISESTEAMDAQYPSNPANGACSRWPTYPILDPAALYPRPIHIAKPPPSPSAVPAESSSPKRSVRIAAPWPFTAAEPPSPKARFTQGVACRVSLAGRAFGQAERAECAAAVGGNGYGDAGAWKVHACSRQLGCTLQRV